MTQNTLNTEKTLLSRLIHTALYGIAVCSSVTMLQAGGFEGANKGDVDLDDYECEDCPVPEEKEFTLKLSLGSVDNEAVRYTRYSGLEDGENFFLSGQSIIRDEDGLIWKTDFHNLGIDSGGLRSELGVQGTYNLTFEYQEIPLTYQSWLRTPLSQSGNSLNLNSGYVVTGSSATAIAQGGFNRIGLETDWQTMGLNFEWHTESNLSYELDYRQLNKEGSREYSVGQMLTAAYIPLPVDSETEDLTATVSWLDDTFYASLSALVSRFDNNYSSVVVEYPLSTIVTGSEFVEIAQDPGNTYNRINLNMRYLYADRSHVKFNYSRGELEQDEVLLPYSLNPIFQSTLPVSSLDAEIVNTDMNLQILHQFAKEWRIKLDYRERDRENNTPVYDWDRLVTDLYVSGSVSNVPYDYSTKTFSATMSLYPAAEHRVNLRFVNEDKERTLQQITSNSETGIEIQYLGRFEGASLLVSAEQYNRSSSEKTLIDYLEVTENPLLSRFNVAERDQDKIRIMASIPISDSLDMSLTYADAGQDYRQSIVGLWDTNQEDFGLDLGWIISDTAQLAVYYQEQTIDARIAGSSNFSYPDWLAATQDDIQSYGFDVRFSELFEQAMTLTISINQSDAASDVVVYKVTELNALPQINYDWTQAEIKLTYPWSEKLDIEFKYHYQDFGSQDYAIDYALPGDVVQLLTMGDLSDEYQVNYLQLSAIYRF